MVRPGGLEPPTYGSANRRSIQLSHGRMRRIAADYFKVLYLYQATLRQAQGDIPTSTRGRRNKIHQLQTVPLVFERVQTGILGERPTVVNLFTFIRDHQMNGRIAQ